MKKNRILIFTGGNLGSSSFEEIKEGDIIVGVDRGALHLVKQHIYPDICLGDFDSVSDEERNEIESNCKQLLSCDPIMKDLTDTEMAFNWAIDQQPAEIWVMGGMGSRFDHSLANVHLLLKGLRSGISCCIRDEKNEVRLMDHHMTLKKGLHTHVSLLPLSMQVTGITLRGFQYPLEEASISIGDTVGISNVLIEEVGEIDIKTGFLLVIKSRD